MIVDAGGLRALQDPGTGKLTPGVHRASIGALRDYACTTSHRERIWEAFELWHREALVRIPHERLWFGGSYITSTAAPHDIDVLAWVPPTAPPQGSRIADLMTILSGATLGEGGEVLHRLGRLQPIAGLVDGFQAREGKAFAATWKQNWGNDWDEDTGELIPGTAKGIVEVIV